MANNDRALKHAASYTRLMRIRPHGFFEECIEIKQGKNDLGKWGDPKVYWTSAKRDREAVDNDIDATVNFSRALMEAKDLARAWALGNE